MKLGRAGVVLFAFACGCASATQGTGHDMRGGGGDAGGGDDLSMGDLAVADFAMPDLSMFDLVPPADLIPHCDTDAGDRLCQSGGLSTCIHTSQCCVASDCPPVANGQVACGSNSCGFSCNVGFKPCGNGCIPNANCCTSADCTSPGDPCKTAMGATCNASGVCQYPAVQCQYTGQFCNSMGNCVCPTGQHVCQASNSCIPDGTCCTSGDCTAIAGEVCPMPGGTCTCLSGFTACQTGGFSQCILKTGCCTNADCTVGGQTCSGPGGSCNCPVNTKACGSNCIPIANCCTDGDCASVSGETCQAGSCQCPVNQHVCNTFKICINNGTCCIDSDCPLTGEKCSGIGGSCSCPSGTKPCGTTNSCISTSQCCGASDCTGGQLCVGGPPGTCQCPTGQKLCGNTCINNSTCCNNSDCPPTKNDIIATCSGAGGSCSIPNGGCASGFFDINKIYSDGCECPDTQYGTSCGGATGLTALGYSDSRTETSQLPASGTEAAWFLIGFPGNNVDRNVTTYHPHIQLTQGAGEYVFDVYTNCSNALAWGCFSSGDSANPTNLTSYDIVANGGDFNAPGSPAGCGGSCTSAWNPSPMISGNQQIYIKVHRANTSAVSCNPFTLVISD